MITLAAVTFSVGMLAFSIVLLVHVIRNYNRDKKAHLKKSNLVTFAANMPEELADTPT